MAKTTRRRTKTMIEEVNETLRNRVRFLETENESLKRQISFKESLLIELTTARNGAVGAQLGLYDAVRVLAEQVSRTTIAGRKARKEARDHLEGSGIYPPHTLGRSRASPKKKRKKEEEKEVETKIGVSRTSEAETKIGSGWKRKSEYEEYQ